MAPPKVGGRVVFAGCARDCARHLPSVLANIAAIGGLFDETAFVVAENDSTDDTVARLDAWGTGHPGYLRLAMPGLGNVPARTVRLEAARNACIEMIRHDAGVRDFDWLVVLDLDEPNKPPADLAAMARAFAFLAAAPERVAAFPNQRGVYYDIWALRHRELCPGDAWEAVFDHALKSGCSDQEAFDAVFAPLVRPIDPAGAPIEVESAFGGLGIYKLAAVMANSHPYVGTTTKLVRQRAGWRAHRWQSSEHVHFHAGLRQQGGRLFILPDLINCSTEGFMIPPSSFRRMLM